MPRIPNNLRERAIGMLVVDMSTEHVARHNGCSSRAIRNLRIGFRTTVSTNDLPCRGRPRVTTRGQDRYIMNMYLRSRLQTATATAANILGFIIESVRKLIVCGRTVYMQRHRLNRLTCARVHTRWIRRRWNTVLC